MANTSSQLNKSLVVVGIVMLVNALSYGTIIPLLYPFAQQYGMDATKLSWLFASFSLAQFFATPIIGRLSDKYGRKPLLLMCLFGTSVSLALFGSAKSIGMLFFARILDGITGGNIPVAQAIIADKSSAKDRARAFGILGATFGFGFTFGPAIGGFLSQYSMSTPFYFGSALALIGTILGIIMLTETNTTRESKTAFQLIDLGLLSKALKSTATRGALIVAFISSIAINAMIIGFQSYTVDVLALSTSAIGLVFTLWGLQNIITQGFALQYMINMFSSKRKLIRWSLLLSALVICLAGYTGQLIPFIIVMQLFGLLSSPQNAVLTGMLSERTKAEDQGGMLGLNQSLTSIAQIIGPLSAGLVAAINVSWVFILTGVFYVVGLMFSQTIPAKDVKKLDL